LTIEDSKVARIKGVGLLRKKRPSATRIGEAAAENADSTKGGVYRMQNTHAPGKGETEDRGKLMYIYGKD